MSSFFSPGSAQNNGLGSFFGLNPFQVNGSAAGGSNNPLVAPLTTNQNSSVGTAFNLGQPNAGALPGAQNQINQYLNPNYPSSLATSPQTQQAVQAAVNPILNAFQTTTVPGLVSQFTQAGQRVNAQQGAPGTQNIGEGTGAGSSAFDRAAGIAQGNLLNTVGQTAGGIENSAYQAGLQQQQAAVGQAQQLSTTEVNNLVQSLQAQALPQMIQQYGINQGLQLFQQQLSSVLAALGLSAQASQPAIAYNQQGTSSGSASPGIGSFFGTQGVGAAIGALAPIISDRRMKTNIAQVGRLENGLPVYSFNYINSDIPQIGLMADEVEKVNPGAVVTGPLGIKMVNYALAVV